MKIKTDDIVEIISGQDRGQRGKVLSVDHASERVVVEGRNLVYKHVRRSQKNPQGGRLRKEMPISVSNVMVVCPVTNKASRIGFRYLADGSKERYAKVSGATLGMVAPARPAYAKK